MPAFCSSFARGGEHVVARRSLPARDGRLGRAQRAAEPERALPLLVGQVGVARAEREPVRLADGRADLDPDRHVEVADELADDERLLRVLLAEVGDVGPDHVEELRHDRRDAREVARARGAAEHVGQAGDLDRGREAVGVDLLVRRARTGCRRPHSSASAASRASSRG